MQDQQGAVEVGDGGAEIMIADVVDEALADHEGAVGQDDLGLPFGVDLLQARGVEEVEDVRDVGR